MRKLFVAGALALAWSVSWAFWAATASSAEAVFPSSSSLGLVPPPGMSRSTKFQGFEDQTTGASIVLAELPAEAHVQILASFTPEGMRPSGFAGAAPAVDWPIAGGEGRLMRGSQEVAGITFRKWVILAKTGTLTAIVTSQIPEAATSAERDAAIEAALRTIAVRAAPSLDEQVKGLPFGLGDRAGFRVVRTLAGAGLILTEGPQDTVQDLSQPLVVVASSLRGVPPKAERDAFARRAFATVAHVNDIQVDDAKRDERGGADWVRIVGHGTDAKTGAPVQVEQVIRFGEDGYVRAIGIWRRDEEARFGARFGRLADSITAR